MQTADANHIMTVRAVVPTVDKLSEAKLYGHRAQIKTDFCADRHRRVGREPVQFVIEYELHHILAPPFRKMRRVYHTSRKDQESEHGRRFPKPQWISISYRTEFPFVKIGTIQLLAMVITHPLQSNC